MLDRILKTGDCMFFASGVERLSSPGITRCYDYPPIARNNHGPSNLLHRVFLSPLSSQYRPCLLHFTVPRVQFNQSDLTVHTSNGGVLALPSVVTKAWVAS